MPTCRFFILRKSARRSDFTQSKTMRAIAIYACKAEDSSELSFNTGDFINKVQKDEEEGWFSGELNGRRGLFPGNYVRFEEDPPGPPITNIAHILAHLPTAPERPAKLNAQDTRRRLQEKSNSIVTAGSLKFAQNSNIQSMYAAQNQSQGYEQSQAPQIPSRPAETGNYNTLDLSKKKKPPPPPGKQRESLIDLASKKSPPPSPPSGRSSSVSSGRNSVRFPPSRSGSSANTQSLLQRFESMNTTSTSSGSVTPTQKDLLPRGSQTSRPVTSYTAQTTSSSNQQSFPVMPPQQRTSQSYPILSNGSQQSATDIYSRQSFVQQPSFGSYGQTQPQSFAQNNQNTQFQGYQSFSNTQIIPTQGSTQNYNGAYLPSQQGFSSQQQMPYGNTQQPQVMQYGNFQQQQNMPYNSMQAQMLPQRNMNQGYTLQQPLISTNGFNQPQIISQRPITTQNTHPGFFNGQELNSPAPGPVLPIFERLSKLENTKPQIPTRPSSDTKPVSIFDKLNEKPTPPALPGSRPTPSATLRSTSLTSTSLPPRPVQGSFRDAIPRYTQLFKMYDRRASGMLLSNVVKDIWTRSQLDFKLLGEIWYFKAYV